MNTAGRVLMLFALLAAGMAALWWIPARVPASDTSRLTWLADAHQFGPVGYRDPAGAISPDGQWIAYSEGRFLRVRSAKGGPIVDLPAGDAQIRNLAWSPDNRAILTDGLATQTGWALYDRVDGTRRPLWHDRDPLQGAKISDLRQLAWSPDGRSIAASSTAMTARNCGPSRRTVRPRAPNVSRAASGSRYGHRTASLPA